MTINFSASELYTPISDVAFEMSQSFRTQHQTIIEFYESTGYPESMPAENTLNSFNSAVYCTPSWTEKVDFSWGGDILPSSTLAFWINHSQADPRYCQDHIDGFLFAQSIVVNGSPDQYPTGVEVCKIVEFFISELQFSRRKLIATLRSVS